MLPTWGGPFRCTGADPEHFGLPGVVHFATQGPIQAIFVDSPSTGKFPMNLPVDRELAETSRNCRCTVLIVAMINNLIINISIISLISIIIIIHIIMLIIIYIIIIFSPQPEDDAAHAASISGLPRGLTAVRATKTAQHERSQPMRHRALISLLRLATVRASASP